MPTLRLSMEDTLESDFDLFALHSPLADYRIAFMFNKYLGLQLRRNQHDIDFTDNGYDALFPLFNFDDSKTYRKFFLVGNRCTSKKSGMTSTGGLFADEPQESRRTLCLVPELKKADYLLKVETHSPLPPTFIQLINNIPEVVLAYKVNNDQLKSKKNLIFE